MYLYFVLIKFVEFIHVGTRTRKTHYFSHLTGGVNSSLKGVHSTDISGEHEENVYHRTNTAKFAPTYLFLKVHGLMDSISEKITKTDLDSKLALKLVLLVI